MDPSTAQHCRICPVLAIIIHIDYFIPIQWSNCQDITWLVLLATWRLDLCPPIIATGIRQRLPGTLIPPLAGCLQVRAIYLIPEGSGVVSPAIVHLVMGIVKHLPHNRAAGCPPLPKQQTPAPEVRSIQLQLWKVASCDWIKQDYVIKEVLCPFNLDVTCIEYPLGFTDVFRDEYLYTALIKWQA